MGRKRKRDPGQFDIFEHAMAQEDFRRGYDQGFADGLAAKRQRGPRGIPGVVAGPDDPIPGRPKSRRHDPITSELATTPEGVESTMGKVLEFLKSRWPRTFCTQELERLVGMHSQRFQSHMRDLEAANFVELAGKDYRIGSVGVIRLMLIWRHKRVQTFPEQRGDVRPKHWNGASEEDPGETLDEAAAIDEELARIEAANDRYFTGRREAAARRAARAAEKPPE